MINIKHLAATVVVAIATIASLTMQPVLAQTTAPSGVPTSPPASPVKVGVNDTKLTLTGCASPNAFIQFFNDNSPVGTATANSQGRFSKQITIANNQAGLHNIKLYYEDANNRTSSVVSQNINLSSQINTSLDLLLPTTIEHSPEPVLVGGYLIYRGSTCPGALVNVQADNNLTLAANTDSRGNWYIIANTDNYYIGGHVYDALSKLGNQISQPTQKYQFNVTGQGPAPSAPPDNLNAPIITEPADLFLSSSNTITVHGTGPLNAQIELFMDQSPVGSVFTNPNGEWSMVVNLTSDLQTFTARSCYQESCGDFGNTVRIRLSVDVVVCKVGFRLADYRYWGLAEQDGVDLTLTSLSDGSSYEALIDWGDAAVEHITIYPDQLNKFHHVFDFNGQYNGSITLSDGQGCQQVGYFSVLVTPGNPPNWWLLAIIPLAGSTVYVISQFANAYNDQQPAPARSKEQPKPPTGWPLGRPWPKPAYGADKDPPPADASDDSSAGPKQ